MAFNNFCRTIRIERVPLSLNKERGQGRGVVLNKCPSPSQGEGLGLPAIAMAIYFSQLISNDFLKKYIK